MSNDVIAIVDDILYGKPIYEPVAAYRFLLEEEKRPFWANEVLEREVERFTYGKVDGNYLHTQFIVKLSNI